MQCLKNGFHRLKCGRLNCADNSKIVKEFTKSFKYNCEALDCNKPFRYNCSKPFKYIIGL